MESSIILLKIYSRVIPIVGQQDIIIATVNTPDDKAGTSILAFSQGLA